MQLEKVQRKAVCAGNVVHASAAFVTSFLYSWSKRGNNYCTVSTCCAIIIALYSQTISRSPPNTTRNTKGYSSPFHIEQYFTPPTNHQFT